MGFLVKIKMKAYKKLTVLMCCQIVARKSVAPSSGDFQRRLAPRQACGPDPKFRRKLFFSKNFYTPSAAAAGPPQVCNLNDFSRATCFFCLAGLARKSPIENLTLIFFVFKKSFFLKHHGDL